MDYYIVPKDRIHEIEHNLKCSGESLDEILSWYCPRVNRVKVYLEMQQKYGNELQTIALVEELGELVTAISKSLLGKESNVIEEVADVYICLEQYIAGLEGSVEDEIDRKIEKMKNKYLGSCHE